MTIHRNKTLKMKQKPNELTTNEHAFSILIGVLCVCSFTLIRQDAVHKQHIFNSGPPSNEKKDNNRSTQTGSSRYLKNDPSRHLSVSDIKIFVTNLKKQIDRNITINDFL